MSAAQLGPASGVAPWITEGEHLEATYEGAVKLRGRLGRLFPTLFPTDLAIFFLPIKSVE